MVHHSLKEFRTSAGSLGGIAGANLVALAMVISLVYAYACNGFCVKLWIATRLYSGLSCIIFK
ncbi:hypothetical protein AAHB55_09900 [Bacillus cereus]